MQKINIQIGQAVLIFKNFWSFRSIRNILIATDCSVFDRFCFLCVVCLFWWFYGFLWRVFAIEKLEYSRYNEKIKYEWFDTVLIVVVCFLILTGLTKVLLSFVWLKFSSFLGYLTMDEGIRSKKTLSLGIPMESRAMIQREASN